MLIPALGTIKCWTFNVKFIKYADQQKKKKISQPFKIPTISGSAILRSICNLISQPFRNLTKCIHYNFITMYTLCAPAKINLAGEVLLPFNKFNLFCHSAE